MKVGNYGMDDGTVIKVYDPTKKELIGEYSCAKEASKKLGIAIVTIKSACISKNRRFSPILNKKVAIRMAFKQTN